MASCHDIAEGSGRLTRDDDRTIRWVARDKSTKLLKMSFSILWQNFKASLFVLEIYTASKLYRKSHNHHLTRTSETVKILGGELQLKPVIVLTFLLQVVFWIFWSMSLCLHLHIWGLSLNYSYWKILSLFETDSFVSTDENFSKEIKVPCMPLVSERSGQSIWPTNQSWPVAGSSRSFAELKKERKLVCAETAQAVTCYLYLYPPLVGEETDQEILSELNRIGWVLVPHSVTRSGRWWLYTRKIHEADMELRRQRWQSAAAEGRTGWQSDKQPRKHIFLFFPLIFTAF